MGIAPFIGKASGIKLVSAGSINGAPAFGQPTTAGNFLVCCFASGDTTLSLSGTGWVTDVTDTVSGFGGVLIAHKANCGASESAPSLTGTNPLALLAEFSGVAVATPTDRTIAAGDNVNLVSSVTATMVGTDSLSAELVIAAAFVVNFGTSNPTFTDAFNNGPVTVLGEEGLYPSAQRAVNFGFSVTTANGSADSWQSSIGAQTGRYDLALASYKHA